MTTIVSVKPSGSVSTVDFDDGTSFRCTRDFARRSNLNRGQQIDPIFVDRLRLSATTDLALSLAERLNRRGRYSRREIEVKLRDAEIPWTFVGPALDTLAEHGDLSDFAVALTVTRTSLQRFPDRGVPDHWRRFRETQTRRLRLRGFDPAAADQALRQAWAECEQIGSGA